MSPSKWNIFQPFRMFGAWNIKQKLWRILFWTPCIKLTIMAVGTYVIFFRHLSFWTHRDLGHHFLATKLFALFDNFSMYPWDQISNFLTWQGNIQKDKPEKTQSPVVIWLIVMFYANWAKQTNILLRNYKICYFFWVNLIYYIHYKSF